jgi:outer membrane murein-binding lipoprotein Lpp
MAINKLLLQVVVVGILFVAGCVQASSQAFLPAGVTSEVDDSPVDKAATQVGLRL